MSKLFKLKEWLIVPDAARHLSIAFGEEVSKADVLRLALDGRLRLSVNFVNHAVARCGKIVPIDEAEYDEVPSIDGMRTVRLYRGPTLFTEGRVTDVVELEKTVAQLAGIYDLPMIGNERLDIEHQYQQLTGGPAITIEGLDGTFVEGKDSLICQLQESWDDNEYQIGSTAQLEKLKQHIAKNNIGAAEAEKLLSQHKEDRKKFLEKKKSRPASESYYPAGGLPVDSVLVVRTDALRKFEESIKDTPTNAEKPLTNIERDSLLKLVIGMAMKGYSYDPTAKKNSAVADIVADLALLGLPLGDDTIRKYLKQGNEQLPAKPTNT